MKDLSWTEYPIHVVDFEGNLASGIVEYGVATLQQGSIVQVKTEICKAAQPITLRDTQVHGIRTEDTLNCEPFESAWALFSELRKGAPMAAHHALYENMLLRAVWPYCSPAPDFLRGEGDSCEWGPWVDSCELYRVLFPGLRSYKLSILVKSFDLQASLDDLATTHVPKARRRYHCALYDALASAVLLSKLAENALIQKKPLEWLLLTSMVSEKKRQEHQQMTLF